ncbi:type II toxin-antitoxin system mRNA interferase toxin, RelE/StbE family [Parvibaculum lavamentivorans]|uniref:type II toxin-antitoxin system RelE/ParE family toxin n=1 Tax=Parvibaculum lavamentivorans TaxID=256618 RepID=UPI0000ED4583
MLSPVRSTQFKRDVKRAEKRGKDLGKLKRLLALLIERQPLPSAYRDHPLKGKLERIQGCSH